MRKNEINAGNLGRIIEKVVRKKFPIPAEHAAAVPLLIQDVLTGGLLTRLCASVSPNLPPAAQAKLDSVRRIQQSIHDFLSKRGDLFYQIAAFTQKWLDYLRADTEQGAIQRFFTNRNGVAFERGKDGKPGKIICAITIRRRKTLERIFQKATTADGKPLRNSRCLVYFESKGDKEILDWLKDKNCLGFEVTAAKLANARERYLPKFLTKQQ